MAKYYYINNVTSCVAGGYNGLLAASSAYILNLPAHCPPFTQRDLGKPSMTHLPFPGDPEDKAGTCQHGFYYLSAQYLPSPILSLSSYILSTE